MRRVREYDRRLHTIAVESCAPAPMWALQPQLTRLFPGMSVSASLEEVEAIPGHVTGGSCDLGILPGAMEAAGVTPVVVPIRGGTDGARLSYMGLPCPNLSTGGLNFHGVHEYIPADALLKMTQVLVNLVTAQES